MKVYRCENCISHCKERSEHPEMIARVDAEQYCSKFWNPESEPFFKNPAKIKR